MSMLSNIFLFYVKDMTFVVLFVVQRHIRGFINNHVSPKVNKMSVRREREREMERGREWATKRISHTKTAWVIPSF